MFHALNDAVTTKPFQGLCHASETQPPSYVVVYHLPNVCKHLDAEVPFTVLVYRSAVLVR